MQIMIVKLGALGDVVRTTALLPALKQKFPSAEVTWITSPSAKALLELNPLIDHLYCDDELPSLTTDWDWILSLDDEEAICKKVSTQRSQKISGAFWDEREKTLKYSEDVSEWFGMGILRPKAQGGLLKANELKKQNQASHPEIFYRMLDLPLPIHRPQIGIHSEERQKALLWMKEKDQNIQSWVGLNTGASSRWEFKSWGLESTVELAQKIVQTAPNTGVVILGGSEETKRNQQIATQAQSKRVFLGPTDWSLREFSALVENCKVLVTSDSLALHIGLAFSIPIVSFFGPTSAAEIDLYDKGQKILTPLACHCCYLKTCDIRPHCMQSISVDDIYRATAEFL